MEAPATTATPPSKGKPRDANSVAGKVRTAIAAVGENASVDAYVAVSGLPPAVVKRELYRMKYKETHKGKPKAKKKVRGRPPKTETQVKPIEKITLKYETHPLYPVFMDAIKQVVVGKGIRHGGDSVQFLEQPWAHYAKLHGKGFLTGQAAKKLEEAASTKVGDAYEQELLGAAVYVAMAVLHNRGGKHV
jgi:hypothetical protein